MKSFTSVWIAALLCLALLAGCGAPASEPEQKPESAPAAEAPAPEAPAAPTETPEEEAGQETAPAGALLGGWTASEDWTVTDELRAVFEEAVKVLGVEYEPVAYLGSQTVNGTMRSFLCEAGAVTPAAAHWFALVKVLEQPGGGASLEEILPMGPDGQFTDAPQDGRGLAGGWSVPESEQEGLEAFDKAAESLLGVDYAPVRVLGRQVVAGVNYRLLCQARAVAPGAPAYYCLMTVYRDLNGNASVTEIAELSPGGELA